ncbi:MAG TPA: hypothetical protein VIJ38_01715 [Acidobacteriaceae bacterium]
MDLIYGGIGLVVGAIIGATIGYKWISAELVTAKADLSNILAKVKQVVDPATAAAVTPQVALAAAVAAVKTKV